MLTCGSCLPPAVTQLWRITVKAVNSHQECILLMERSASQIWKYMFFFLFFFPWSDNLAGRLSTILHIVSVNYTQLYKMNHIYHFYSMNIHNWMFLHIAHLKRNGWLRVWRITVISHVLPSVVSFSERGMVSKKTLWKDKHAYLRCKGY